MKIRKYIEKMEINLVRINEKQKKALIEYWGENIGNEFTEQDISKQTCKIMQKTEI